MTKAQSDKTRDIKRPPKWRGGPPPQWLTWQSGETWKMPKNDHKFNLHYAHVLLDILNLIAHHKQTGKWKGLYDEFTKYDGAPSISSTMPLYRYTMSKNSALSITSLNFLININIMRVKMMLLIEEKEYVGVRFEAEFDDHYLLCDDISIGNTVESLLTMLRAHKMKYEFTEKEMVGYLIEFTDWAFADSI